MSQSQLAKILGKTQATVSQWETGLRAPGLEELLKLAGMLDVQVAELVPPTRERREAKLLLRAFLATTEEHELKEPLERFFESVEQRKPLPRRITVAADRPLRAAQQLLSRAQEHGVRGARFDIDALARLCGAHVIPAAFPEGLSGLLVDQDGVVAIGVNNKQRSGRKRFTVAHELGHHLLEHHDRFHVDLGPSNELGDAPSFDWKLEREANDFAANVLMPASMVRERYADNPSSRALAKTFGVSPIAMGYRLVSLGLREVSVGSYHR